MNTVEASAFHAELRRLCKGRGLLGQDFANRLGPALIRRMKAGDPGEQGAWRRGTVAEWLGTWLPALPADLEFVARVALGLHPGAGQRFLGERIRYLAEQLERDERTVRRRLDEALCLLAEFLAAGTPAAMPGTSVPEPPVPASSALGPPVPGPPVAGASTPGERKERTGWYCENVHTVVRLDLPEPEILEMRRIAVTAAELRHLVISVSVPPAPGGPAGELFADVMFGGLLVSREHPSKSLFRFVIEPAHPLRAGERHDFALKYRFSDGHRMVPHYALTPLSRCDAFLLRVRFPLSRPPERVWLLDAVPPRTLDDPPAGLPEVALDRAAEARAGFGDLAIGHAFGLRWQQPEP
ncbi:hypothetical protein E1264_27370 [Actinomadura sp. KC216]|uniref:hypothetical protein n=1 Tax=Actinomadura sp. KC216 TaxID=2530370 RepID=UPI00104AE5CC|nr:hypothetical protein [Actinomadura sp. KC216]TDB83715.1 hypothetical protein E1264_27370 [Actinomadura sp. KC216]